MSRGIHALTETKVKKSITGAEKAGKKVLSQRFFPDGSFENIYSDNPPPPPAAEDAADLL